MNDLKQFVVGETYPALAGPEGIHFTLTDSGAELIIRFDKPTNREIRSVKSGQAQFRVLKMDNVIWFLSQFGYLEWQDAPFSVHLARRLTKIQDVPEGQGYSLTVTFVDTTGKLEVLRVIGLDTDLSRELHNLMAEQMTESFDGYDRNLNSQMRKYSTEDLVRMARADN